MRLVIKVFADSGKMYVIETPNEGHSLTVLSGEREPEARISAFMELMCDETDEGADRVLEIMSWLEKEMKKRKQLYSKKKPVKKHRTAT
jgi:hypothetical protein